jgi:FkbH-like protein
MKLVEALNVLKRPVPGEATPWEVDLVCGFTPAHLETFLTAHLRLSEPNRRVAVRTGLYGDCRGNLERLAVGPGPSSAAAVVLEWQDLDPRLGLRQLGGWGVRSQADILKTATAQAVRFAEALERVAGSTPVTLCLPTLPIPPVSHLPARQAGPFDLVLRESVASLAARVGRVPGIRVVSPQQLDQLSPPGDRLDVRTELSSGFPYRLPHAAAVAELLARLLRPSVPKKGLITDLDNTLWRGVVGDVGVDGVGWDLDRRGQIHGLYQQTLAALADAGVLIAIASKNDPKVVDEAFGRDDLILIKDRIFPMEVSWGPKSEAVGRILRAWNIGSDSVVFIDDSPMELAEVAAAHPGVEGLLFPRDDEQAAYDLLGRLRDLFGKETVSEEDTFRLESLRRSAAVFGNAEGRTSAPEDFLAEAEAEITLNFSKDPPEPRALELINKTNQFNLNGRRYTDGEWLAHLKDPDSFLVLVAYQDKFGPLGTIAVLTGRAGGDTLFIDHWVMSCRAFSRRIEHQCLAVLFQTSAADDLVFDYLATPKNGPMSKFLGETLGHDPGPGCRLRKDQFLCHRPPLHHRLKGLDAWLTRGPA